MSNKRQLEKLNTLYFNEVANKLKKVANSTRPQKKFESKMLKLTNSPCNNLHLE